MIWPIVIRVVHIGRVTRISYLPFNNIPMCFIGLRVIEPTPSLRLPPWNLQNINIVIRVVDIGRVTRISYLPFNNIPMCFIGLRVIEPTPSLRLPPWNLQVVIPSGKIWHATAVSLLKWPNFKMNSHQIHGIALDFSAFVRNHEFSHQIIFQLTVLHRATFAMNSKRLNFH